MKKYLLVLICLLTLLSALSGCEKTEPSAIITEALPDLGVDCSQSGGPGTGLPSEPPAPQTTAGKASDYASMSEKELVEELTNYRHLIDIYAAPDFAAGLADLEKQCGAYAELVTRENWRELLTQYGTELIEG